TRSKRDWSSDVCSSDLRLSLLKSAIHPDPHADEGHHEFTYSLLPHEGNWQEGETVKEAWELNNPLSCSPGVAEKKEISFLASSKGNIMIDAIKKAEYSDDIVIRVHEYEGKRSNVSLTSDFTIETWQESDLMERPIDDQVNEGQIDFHIKPYEIKTFLVKFTK